MDYLIPALYILEIVFGVGLLIFIHEFGHFIMAKRHGVRVDAFSLGFGPALWKRKKGDTEYRISAIPLGGYVKMAGETQLDERTGAEYEFTSKPAWQRFQIFVAGALMNLLIAFPLCIAAFIAGRNVPGPVLGEPSMADHLAYLQPGDVIIEVDGQKISGLDQYLRAILERPKGTLIPVKVLRDGKEVSLQIKQMGSEQHGSQPPFNVIGALKEDSAGYKAGLRSGDRILKINDNPTFTIEKILEQFEQKDKTVTTLTFTVARKDPAASTDQLLTITVTPEWLTYYELPVDKHLIPCRVGKVIAGTPAENQLQEGDLIEAIDGEPIKNWEDFTDRIKKIDQKDVDLKILRNNQPATVKVRPVNGKLGVSLGEERMEKILGKIQIIAEPPADSFYYKQGLRGGDQLKAIGSVKGGDISLAHLFKQFKTQEKPIPVEVLRNGKTETFTLTPSEKTVALVGFEQVIEKPGFAVGRDLEQHKVFRTYPLGEAIQEGLYEPVSIGILTFKVLYKLFAKEESTKSLAGPVGIFHVTYKSAEQGIGNFLWLLALLAVNLGIFNLLPIPVLDGGHVLLLLFEKIKGKPLSQRFVIIFQNVGLAFLLLLVIYVTYADISRLSS